MFSFARITALSAKAAVARANGDIPAKMIARMLGLLGLKFTLVRNITPWPAKPMGKPHRQLLLDFSPGMRLPSVLQSGTNRRFAPTKQGEWICVVAAAVVRPDNDNLDLVMQEQD